jgi:hypothetical protein
MEYASSVGVSRRRVGVEGLDVDGELYVNRRRRLGVDGGPAVVVDAIGCGRAGETGRWGDDGATSAWRMDVKMTLASSIEGQLGYVVYYPKSTYVPFSASDSEGIILFLEGVVGQLSSKR